MKRNMDLVRTLLLELEGVPAGELYESDQSSAEADRDTIEGHLLLMEDAGLITRVDRELSGNVIVGEITWAGHEFLNAIRPDGVWKRIKDTLREKALGASFAVIQQLGIAYTKQLLGLGE